MRHPNMQTDSCSVYIRDINYYKASVMSCNFPLLVETCLLVDTVPQRTMKQVKRMNE